MDKNIVSPTLLLTIIYKNLNVSEKEGLKKEWKKKHKNDI